jgi:CDP-paratose 2-epimerase
LKKAMLITGGAGFIGVNAAAHFSRTGWSVAVLDNLSRRGARENLAWLRSVAGAELHECDLRDHVSLDKAVARAQPSAVLHLAAQVAVTFSVSDPRHDFETNALGTFNLLEAVRRHCPEATLIYASTNKVYGGMESMQVELRNGRYGYRDRPEGIAEDCQLDFHSPYGCSKGTADQYVLDYARIFGLRTASFRQSCIYGQRQFGVEDQGWVAWFIIATALGRPISVFGDGRQVRDILHVDDLVRAYEIAFDNPARIAGQAFNIGGGPSHTLSLLELLAHLEAKHGRKIGVSYHDWRQGDQKVFVCDIRKAARMLGWTPAIRVEDGLRRLMDWVGENRDTLQRLLG